MKTLIKRLKKLLKIKALLSFDDLYSLNLLLKIDVDFKKALSIIENNKNKKIIKNILQMLEEGNVIEDIILDFVPLNYVKYLKCFISYLSFSKSLDLTQNLINKEKEFKDKFIKAVSYPSLLIMISFLGIYIFNFYFFDTFYNLIKSFKVDTSQLLFYHGILTVFLNVFLVLIVLLLIIFLLVKRNNKQVFYFVLLNRFFKKNFFKTFLTQEFIIYYRQCLLQGLKTKEIFEILLNLKHKPLIKFLSFHIDKRLLESKNYLDAFDIDFLDERLKKFIKIAYYTDQNNELLKTYIENTERLILRKIKIIGVRIQIFSYLVCGFIVYFIYQLLLMPLGIIEKL